MKMNNALTLGSLFDGSGGFPLGGLLAGITPLWASEIEPFPISVTTKRLPFMKHYGDVSAINGADVEPVDIITFGSPCTDMSVAGKRAGLEGKQSVLFYQAIRIIKEMRKATNGEYPRWICWENVFGAFSSSGGADFKAVLEAVVSVVRPDAEVPAPAGDRWPYADIYMGDGWSVAYRTFDAQYWGVPQRRRRVYLIADLTGGSAGEILFKSEGLSGYSPESFRAWQRAARSPQNSSGSASLCLNDQGGSRMDVTEDMTATLRAEAHHPPCIMEAAGFCTEHSSKARSVGYEAETSPTLRAGVVPAAIALENHPTDGRLKIESRNAVQTLTSRMGTGGMNTPLVMDTPKTLKIRSGCKGGGKGALVQEDMSATLSCNNDQTLFEPRVYGICSDKSNSMLSDNPRSGIYEAGSSRTIDANGGNPGCNQGGMAVVETAPAYSASKSSFFTTAEKELAGTLVATDYKDPPLVNDGSGMEFVVRRLTPTECARLQGFPDWWCEGLGMENPTDEEIAFWTEVWETHRKIVGTTDKPKSRKQIVKWLRDPHSDSAEYKMWGNGVALPCVYFVLSGIVWSAQSKAE